MKILLKQRFLAVHHDFYSLLIATKLLTAKLHSLMLRSWSRKLWKDRSRESEPEILESRGWSRAF